LVMGLFGVAEVLENIEKSIKQDVFETKFKGLLPNKQEWKQSALPIARGTFLGFFMGILPGVGAIIPTFISYSLEKRLSKHPEKFGTGMIEGVAGPESANNAGAQTSFIPMLTLGLPSNAVMALMIGAMTIQGIVPGPEVMTKRPELFWGLVASMWIGNLLLVVLNLPLIGIWVQLLKLRYRLLFPAILVFSAIGVYTLNNSPFDVALTALFGVLGYILNKLDCEPAPFMLAFILSPMMEESLRRAMLLSRGDATVFVTRPISLGFLVAAVLLLLAVIAPAVRRRREDVFQGA